MLNIKKLVGRGIVLVDGREQAALVGKDEVCWKSYKRFGWWRDERLCLTAEDNGRRKILYSYWRCRMSMSAGF